MSTDDYKKILDLFRYILENLVAGGLHHYIVMGLNNSHQYNTVKYPAVQYLIKLFKRKESRLFSASKEDLNCIETLNCFTVLSKNLE